VGTRELILEYHSSRNTEHQYLPMLVQFRVSRIEFRDVRRWEVSHLDLPGAETPKCELLNLRIYFGISPIGISWVRDSGLESTRDSPLDIPGIENPRSYIFFIRLSFRDFASRGFRTCEYREILPWVFLGSETPKRPNSSTRRHFRFS
jgi:hypothetical protein